MSLFSSSASSSWSSSSLQNFLNVWLNLKNIITQSHSREVIDAARIWFMNTYCPVNKLFKLIFVSQKSNHSMHGICYKISTVSFVCPFSDTVGLNQYTLLNFTLRGVRLLMLMLSTCFNSVTLVSLWCVQRYGCCCFGLLFSAAHSHARERMLYFLHKTALPVYKVTPTTTLPFFSPHLKKIMKDYT